MPSKAEEWVITVSLPVRGDGSEAKYYCRGGVAKWVNDPENATSFSSEAEADEFIRCIVIHEPHWRRHIDSRERRSLERHSPETGGDGSLTIKSMLYD